MWRKFPNWDNWEKGIWWICVQIYQTFDHCWLQWLLCLRHCAVGVDRLSENGQCCYRRCINLKSSCKSQQSRNLCRVNLLLTLREAAAKDRVTVGDCRWNEDPAGAVIWTNLNSHAFQYPFAIAAKCNCNCVFVSRIRPRAQSEAVHGSKRREVEEWQQERQHSDEPSTTSSPKQLRQWNSALWGGHRWSGGGGTSWGEPGGGTSCSSHTFPHNWLLPPTTGFAGKVNTARAELGNTMWRKYPCKKVASICALFMGATFGLKV